MQRQLRRIILRSFIAIAAKVHNKRTSQFYYGTGIQLLYDLLIKKEDITKRFLSDNKDITMILNLNILK